MVEEDLFRMVRDYKLDQLEILLEHLFELLIQHHGMVEYITELPAEDQTVIKDFLQKAKKAKDNRNEMVHK